LFDICVVGLVTRDIVRIGGKEKKMPGGTAYYASMAMKSLGLNVAIITKVKKEDEALLGDLKASIPVFLGESPRTTHWLIWLKNLSGIMLLDLKTVIDYFDA
jgi:hypothetical protein